MQIIILKNGSISKIMLNINKITLLFNSFQFKLKGIKFDHIKISAI